MILVSYTTKHDTSNTVTISYATVSHGTIVQLSLSLRFGCYGKVPCCKTRETANKQIAL